MWWCGVCCGVGIAVCGGEGSRNVCGVVWLVVWGRWCRWWCVWGWWWVVMCVGDCWWVSGVERRNSGHIYSTFI